MRHWKKRNIYVTAAKTANEKLLNKKIGTGK